MALYHDCVCWLQSFCIRTWVPNTVLTMYTFFRLETLSPLSIVAPLRSTLISGLPGPDIWKKETKSLYRPSEDPEYNKHDHKQAAGEEEYQRYRPRNIRNPENLRRAEAPISPKPQNFSARSWYKSYTYTGSERLSIFEKQQKQLG